MELCGFGWAKTPRMNPSFPISAFSPTPSTTSRWWGSSRVNADYRFVLDNLRTLASHFLTPETEVPNPLFLVDLPQFSLG